MYDFTKKRKDRKIQAIRHTLTPSIGFSYTPDFGDPKYGYYQTRQTDSTGRFAIETDEELGAIIYGNYDYSAGDWQHRYIVTDFSKTQMIWTAKDDRSDISVYERCDGIPEDITGGKTE